MQNNKKTRIIKIRAFKNSLFESQEINLLRIFSIARAMLCT